MYYCKMKKAFLIYLILILSLSTKAQKKGDLIYDEPIIGVWEYVDYDKNPKGGAPIIAEEAQNFINFMPGEHESWFGVSQFKDDPDAGIFCISTFIAHINKNKVYGKLINACAVVLGGTDFSFGYKLNKDFSILTVICNGKSYKYRRFRFDKK